MDDERDLGFTFRQVGAKYVIFHNGKQAASLRGNKAIEFGIDVAEMNQADQQHLMARLTGNYKRGNERTAKNHPRNKR